MAEAKKGLVERLFAEHRGALHAFFYRRPPCRPDARDLVQEVYLRMLRVRDTTLIRDPEAYLFTVAGNLAREHTAVERGHGTAIDLEDQGVQQQLSEVPSFGGQIDQARQVARLHQVLRQLPPKCHAALVLQYQDGLSYAQIAERLGVSTHMVNKYLVQALAHCRRRMARQE
jgi:RNA polymerase sigma factor (sigma-70 family)